jgi:hypothetical protein
VLITDFSGSATGFVFGVIGVELAGFHIVFTSSQFLVGQSAASYFSPAANVLIGQLGQPIRMMAR